MAAARVPPKLKTPPGTPTGVFVGERGIPAARNINSTDWINHAAYALSTEKVLTPSDSQSASIRFSRSRFKGTDRIVFKQAASWMTLPVVDIAAFIAGINAAMQLSDSDIEVR